MFDPADIAALVEDLESAGIRDVTTDPAALNLPGVLVQLAGVREDVLAGTTLELRLLCVSPDRDPNRSMAILADLYNQVVDVIGGPTGTTTTGSLTLPTDATPYPVMAVPFDLFTSPY